MSGLRLNVRFPAECPETGIQFAVAMGLRVIAIGEGPICERKYRLG